MSVCDCALACVCVCACVFVLCVECVWCVESVCVCVHVYLCVCVYVRVAFLMRSALVLLMVDHREETAAPQLHPSQTRLQKALSYLRLSLRFPLCFHRRVQRQLSGC